MPVKKPQLNRTAKLRRFCLAMVSPRAWVQLLKVVNYYHYSHVVPLRQAARSSDCQISPTAAFSYGSRIEIGSRVLIGEGCKVWAGPLAASISIGNDTLLGPNVVITAASYDFRKGSPLSEQPMLESDIEIGKDVWVGAGAVILMGSKIGDGAVVGANSVVRGVIETGAVVAGSPARRIGDRSQNRGAQLYSDAK